VPSPLLCPLPAYLPISRVPPPLGEPPHFPCPCHSYVPASRVSPKPKGHEGVQARGPPWAWGADLRSWPVLGSKDSDPCQVSAPAERGACPNSMHVAASLLSAQAALLLSLQADGPRRGEGARGCLRSPGPGCAAGERLATCLSPAYLAPCRGAGVVGRERGPGVE
jgi:hypothetical protein